MIMSNIKDRMKDEIGKRIGREGLPRDTDIELAVITCMLVDQTCIEEALNLDIRDDHFYDSRYRVIYSKIVEIKYRDGADVDLVLLKNKLVECEEFKDYDQRDMVVFLHDLDSEFAVIINFKQYVERLEDFRQRRENVSSSVRCVEAAYDFSVPVAVDITSRKDSIRRFDIVTALSKPPPPRKWVFRGFLPQGIVATLSGAGGTGKSKFVLYAAVSMATGMRVFDCFQPEEARPVICWFGEDSEQIAWERLWGIAGSCEGLDTGLLGSNLNVYCEQARPLMEMEYNKPVRTDTYYWLKKKLRSLNPA